MEIQLSDSIENIMEKGDITQAFKQKKPFENIVGKGENAGNQHFLLFPQAPPRWLSGERVGLMTWWL